ncbi:hypothetical protein ALC56_04208 [Trachymyrmex septentrionalis]|uniref:Uncharacterized protein n=2 Tax=Trachymyrmex septentrionalis TaxID=34720 RepID=A0A195FM49_9HYME|nr:PREDICTED: uncharacterized protein LOC108746820 isoform X1 [Trachymyrmex septentrionalis]KYN41059.1 hypothetical protein ALC56_04208 [Trachymyrmex septentrionalis]
MEKLCPLCKKKGIRRRIKAFQVNMEEAMWSCEAEECPWPMGYEDLIFFPRVATSCNWEESSFAKEDVPVPVDFTLYTPPETPGSELTKELTEITSAEYSSCPTMKDKIETVPECEFVTSTKESTDSNKSSLFESFELADINSKESKNMNKQIVDVKIVPKIVNIEKTNINLKIFSNIDNNCDNRKLQECNYPFMNTSVMDTFKNLDISNNKYTEVGLSQQYNTTNEQNENDKLQLDATVNEVKTDVGAETLSKAKNTLVDLDTTVTLDTTNQSTENTLDTLDTILEDIIKNKSNLPKDSNDDWLNKLMS